MKLTYEELHRQLDYDSLTGIFKWKVSNSNRIKIGDITGYKGKRGYIEIRINGKLYKAHRLAWFYEHGYMPENDIDHIDRIKHHNWASNLRESSKQCNNRNTGNFAHNTSGVKGVGWRIQKSKWKATIIINGKCIHLGFYTSFDNAVCARLAGEQCVDWEGCDSCSPAYKYVKENIQ